MAKVFVKQQKVQFAYELLLMCFSILNNFLNENKYKVCFGDVDNKEDSTEVNDLKIKFQQAFEEFFDDNKKLDEVVEKYKIRAN